MWTRTSLLSIYAVECGRAHGFPWWGAACGVGIRAVVSVYMVNVMSRIDGSDCVVEENEIEMVNKKLRKLILFNRSFVHHEA